jgi:hypothetical protein
LETEVYRIVEWNEAIRAGANFAELHRWSKQAARRKAASRTEAILIFHR